MTTADPLRPERLLRDDADEGGLVMVGWTHHSCSLDVLEEVHLSAAHRAALLGRMQHAGFGGAVVLSTCSRTEVYAGPTRCSPDDVLAAVSGHVDMSRARLSSTAVRRTGLDAVEHLFRVASGLESRVVGHVEGLRQVARACAEAQDAGTASPLLACLFSGALGAARRVHGTFGLGTARPSLVHLAVDAGLAAVPGHRVPVVVVVGSGPLAMGVLERLTERGHRPFVLARDSAAVARLVSTRRLLPKAALARAVAYADLLVFATSSTSRLLSAAQVRAAMVGRGRPLALVDLSLPRDIDPAVREVPFVRLLDLDDVGGTASVDRVALAAVVGASALVSVEARRCADGSTVRPNFVVSTTGSSVVS